MSSLDETMEFDHVIQVHADGSITDAPNNLYAPDLYDGELQGDGWEFFTTGYSGQYGYNGPIMHNSEYIGGGLERDILAQPGYYVSVVCYWTPEDESDEAAENAIEGWAVAYRPAEA